MALKAMTLAAVDGVGATTATRNAGKSMTATAAGASTTTTKGLLPRGGQSIQRGIGYCPQVHRFNLVMAGM